MMIKKITSLASLMILFLALSCSEKKEEKHFYLGGNFRIRSEV